MRLLKVAVVGLPFMLAATACEEPSGADQYNEAKYVGGVYGSTLDVYGFQAHRNNWIDPYWYFDWRSDRCSNSPDTFSYPISWWAVSGSRVVSVWKACERHDFNWKQFYGIEEFIDPTLDTWRSGTIFASNQRLEDDIRFLCWDRLNGVWAAFLPDCLAKAVVYNVAVTAASLSYSVDFHHNGP
ncbi:MAG: hypothetical protein ABGX65_03365 [Acidimicrobiales bacterium]